MRIRPIGTLPVVGDLEDPRSSRVPPTTRCCGAGGIVRPTADLIGQQIFGIACGHPDRNDAEHLADDPIHKLLLDRDPVAGESLASQPTPSRFENAAGSGALSPSRHPASAAGRQVRGQQGRGAEHERHPDGHQRVQHLDLEQEAAEQARRGDGKREPEGATDDHQPEAARDEQPHNAGFRRLRAPCVCRSRASAGRRRS